METGDFAVPAPPALPERLAGRYTLLERLGGGSSAEVWLGRDEMLGRAVAAKVLHRHLLIDEPARGRFEQEARAVARLSHPGIVAVYDVAADEIGAVMILERVPGSSLAALLRRHQRLPTHEAVRIAAEIAEALAHAHERGVIHRDIKPGNVLIDENGRARLADFGIARVLGEEASRLTAAGTITGTLMYLAPEQLAGHDVDPRADLYGVGLMLYEMLAGDPAYRVTTPVALAEAQRTPPAAVPGLDPVLSGILRGAIEPDRERRYPTAAALAADLRAWLRDADRVSAVAAGTPTLTEGGSNLRRAVGRSWRPRWLAPLAVLVSVVAAALLVTGLAGNVPGRTSPSPGTSGSIAGSATPRSGHPSPSGTTRPSRTPATPSPSPSPSPVYTVPPAFTDAMARLRDMIREGQSSEAIGVRAGDELLVATREIVKNVNEGRVGQAHKLIADFRKTIADMEREGRIRDPAFAERLRQAADELKATIKS
ncbi:MAG: serine/threonine protein kinase [Chloroflexi bacterium]|nr:serine/threonine protein kinase [Chloroflexota bacterium]